MGIKNDVIMLGAVAALGYVLINKVENIGGSAKELITSHVTDTKEYFTEVVDKSSKFVPYTSGEVPKSPQDEVFYEMPKSFLDKDFLSSTGYAASGYRDPSKIGTSPSVDSSPSGIVNTLNRAKSVPVANIESHKIASAAGLGNAPLMVNHNSNRLAAMQKSDTNDVKIEYDTKIKRRFS